MTRIYVARHGETDWNRLGKLQGATDIPLNDSGREQARACGLYFETIPVDAIFTSPLKRASETAKIINEQLNVPIIEISEFRERTFGDAEGMTYEERSKVYPRKNYPNQEHFKAFKKRLIIGLEKINIAYPEGNVLLVAHGAVIHTLFQIVENDDFFPSNARLSNGGVSTVSFEDGKWWLKKYNAIDHLE
ncbi:histidine phosphatase family protein [Kurthia sibirica]|uniref:Histidine phosphatase family protein n=1 Tax=Kurthia sibirica TaxID=202750 RepID=A0A2U3AMU6_9BACL|nr:histidine phosphatase family protein [Kurthia sibirica]PWI25870.1 histidine phosphatase family protein [Kurthia sibirica]GEK34310.1 putative phosphatase PhoE [Kurthia sibirica]